MEGSGDWRVGTKMGVKGGKWTNSEIEDKFLRSDSEIKKIEHTT